MALVYCYLCHHFYDEADGVFDRADNFACDSCNEDLNE